MDIVTELEHYLSKNELDKMTQEMMVQCLRERPDEPLGFMLKSLMDRNANKATRQACVATSSEGIHVAVSHPDPEVQKWLADHRVQHLFLALVERIAKDQPNNVLSYAATAAHQLHKDPPPSMQ